MHRDKIAEIAIWLKNSHFAILALVRVHRFQNFFLPNAFVRKAEVPAGKYYDSDNDSVSRASLTTEAWRGKILGMQGGIRARGRARMELKKGATSPTEGSDDNDVDAASPSLNSGQPPPHASEASDAGAREA